MLGSIACGDLGESYVDKDGETQYGETRNADRIAAVKLLLAYGEGTPVQRQEISGPDGGPIEHDVAGSPRERILSELDRVAARSQATKPPR